MRLLFTLINDIRYQVKYGFYLLYAFISAVYVAVLFVTPAEYRKIVASVVILTDPAMLGMFFIGGIWLLEKEEGLHMFWRVSPLKGLEYIISKAVSLSVISTVSATLIVLIGLQETTDYVCLSIGVFIGSFVFTTIGLTVASYARTVNNYMMIAMPPTMLLSTPPILAAFGVSHPILEILPGTALWRVIGFSIGMTNNAGMRLWIILAIWLGIALVFANRRIPAALQTEGGDKP